MAMLLCAFSANAQESVVAKIGDVEYTTFASAMDAADAATGDVTVEVYGAVEFVDGMELDGSYTAITFTGMSEEAKITINQTAGGDYLTAHGKTVAFNDLILAKANPAWSGNSGHMGNYFSIQGGTVTYTYCTFPNGACTSTATAVYNNCTFQNASEYGLWVYDDALVTVNGGTIDSTKGIKVYSEGEDSVTSTLTVQNATFTENVTAKPAVAIGYAESITLIGNTYNNTTGHVELDSGSDADCDGIAFVAKDSEGNDISSELTVVDRSNSSAACGVLVDGKIYTTVTTAAAEATSGSTVTLLYSTTETVELPEGVTLDTNGFTADNVTVATSGVAKIGSTTYATFAEALTAASAMSGDVTIEVYDKVTLNTAFSGSYSSINFVGKDTDAEIYLDVQGYITATGKKVSFTDLTLSKSAGGYMTNAGFMNVAFGIYDVVEVAYTNCVFANGAYASSGNVTFNGCTFYRSYDKYGLWAYGDVNATVEGCTFADYRGIKMYAEGAAKTVDLTVKNTDFSAVNDKPAIVLTYGESVVLEGNTYSTTGTFELDLDGAPNGTAVTSDVAPTCKNDNGACGVLVDGKIYTTVAQAVEVATEGSNVTLLYSTTDAVEFAEGVNLTLASGVIADNVTVATSGVAKIGDTKYATLAEAVAAVEDGGTITMIANETFTENNRYDNGGWWDGLGYSGDKSFTIDLNNFTISQDGALNDYLMWFKNDGAKDNTITLKNGTLDAGTTAYCALATASSNAKKITVNLENISLINNNSNGSTVKVRGGAVLNVKDGTVITGKDSYLGVECSAATVNIYDGAEIYMNGTSSYNGCLAGAGGNGTINVYGGKGLGKSGGFIAMTSGGTINVEGGEWTANTDGAYANDNKSVLVAQSDKQYNAGAGNSIVNVTGGTFKGGYNCYGNAAGDAQINISGGNFNADPATYLAQNYVAVENNGVWNVELAAAKIGETKYATLEEAFAAAAEGETITLLADATPALTSQRAITKAAVIDLGGNTLTLTEDDLYFGTTTFKNGTIVVDPSVKPSTAVFWMFANQTLTFDAVKVVATGVTGTYLIGLDGDNSDLNLLNGSEILIENTTALDLDVICVNASTGNDIVVENSKVNVTNLDGRVFFRGNYTVKDSEVSLAGITKAGFRIEAGQTLSIEGTSTVTIEGEPRDGGIHITDATATYTKAETATVNATVNAPAPAYVAKIGEQGYETLAAALEAANDCETVTLVWAEGDDAIAMNGAVCGNKTVTITGTANVDWSKGFFFVGRGATGNGKVIFNGANLTSVSNSSAYGFNVSGSKAGDDETNDGAIELVNSTIVLDYMLNKGTMSLDNSTLTVKNGFSVTGRKASESATGADATATMTLTNNSKVIVNNYNGMGIGHEAFGIMNIDATSTFEGTQNFVVAANGTMNVAAGGAVKVNGTLTVNGTLVSAGDIAATIAAGTGATIEISGGVYTQDVNEWCVDGYVALPDLNGNYVVGAKPTATVNNLGMTTVKAGDYSVWNGSFDQNTEDDGDMPLSFVMQFLADQDAEAVAASPYANWYGDFVITFTGLENGSFTADGCYLAGHYGSFGWVKVPVDGMLIEEGVRYPVMLGVGMGIDYKYICSDVEDFKCALYLTPEILAANPNIKVNLELGIVDSSKEIEDARDALINNENVYSVTDYTYDAEDFVVEEPVQTEYEFVDGEFDSYDNAEDVEGATVKYSGRNVSTTWTPLYVPFEIPAEMLLNNGYEVGYITGVREADKDNDGTIDDLAMEIIQIKNTSAILYANHPYFIRSTAGAQELVIELTDVTLYKAEEKVYDSNTIYNKYDVKGNLSLRDGFTDADRGISGGIWEPFVDENETLKPFRFYLTISSRGNSPYYGVDASAVKSMSIVVRGEENEDGTTTIYDVEVDRENDGAIYDLQGRRVLEPEKGGMYIVNGKKVLVK